MIVEMKTLCNILVGGDDLRKSGILGEFKSRLIFFASDADKTEFPAKLNPAETEFSMSMAIQRICRGRASFSDQWDNRNQDLFQGDVSKNHPIQQHNVDQLSNGHFVFSTDCTTAEQVGSTQIFVYFSQ
ncbi:MAG: hypothetical protein U0798_13885 [Gemmataceae bacterium]